jgi:hypothetical protein
MLLGQAFQQSRMISMKIGPFWLEPIFHRLNAVSTAKDL